MFAGAGAPALRRHSASFQKRFGFPRADVGSACTVEMNDAGRPSPRNSMERFFGLHHILTCIVTERPPFLLLSIHFPKRTARGELYTEERCIAVSLGADDADCTVPAVPVLVKMR